MMLRLSDSAVAFCQTQIFEISGAAQQINGREGETAAFLSAFFSYFRRALVSVSRHVITIVNLFVSRSERRFPRPKEVGVLFTILIIW